MSQDHERDEFDEIAAKGGPVGVHRAPRPWWSRVLPPLLAFLIAGAVAFAIAMLLWNRDIGGGEAEADATPAVTTSPTTDTSPTLSAEAPSPEESPTPETTPSPTPTESAEPEPEPEIVYDVQLHVRNGASIQGLAGGQQEELTEAGYTNIEANNIDSSLIPGDANVVTFDGDQFADTAEDIAAILGIEAVDGSGTPGGAEIEVLLASDPDA